MIYFLKPEGFWKFAIILFLTDIEQKAEKKS